MRDGDEWGIGRVHGEIEITANVSMITFDDLKVVVFFCKIIDVWIRRGSDDDDLRAMGLI